MLLDFDSRYGFDEGNQRINSSHHTHHTHMHNHNSSSRYGSTIISPMPDTVSEISLHLSPLISVQAAAIHPPTCLPTQACAEDLHATSLLRDRAGDRYPA